MKNPFDPGYYRTEELRGFGFKSVGENVSIARNCTIIGLANISIGNNVRIDGYTTLAATTGQVRIGNYIHLGGGCHFSAAEDLTFGDFGGTSQGVRIYTASDDYTGRALMGPMVPKHCRRIQRGPVVLGRYAVLGAGTVVLPGVEIAEGSVVGAQSLVTKSLAPWGVYFGSPVKRLKERSRALLAHEARIMAENVSHVA